MSWWAATLAWCGGGVESRCVGRLAGDVMNVATKIWAEAEQQAWRRRANCKISSL